MASWDERWMQSAFLEATFSKDRSTQVGAVIVTPDNIRVVDGWNGFPRGIDDNKDELHQRPEKYKWTIHAEVNAILTAAREGRAIYGCRLYCNFPPCASCALLIAQTGISEVIVPHKDNLNASPETIARWEEDQVKAREIFAATGVKYRFLEYRGG